MIMVMRGRNLPDHRPSHPYDAGAGHVEFSPTRDDSVFAASAKRGQVFGESREGWVAPY